MAWRYHGMATCDPYNAKAHGSCDFCARQWDLDRLQYQYEFRGDVLFNTRFRVCPDCMDKPYEGNRPIKLPPDPVPVLDPRVEPFLQEENTAGTFFQPSPTPPPISLFYVSESGVPYYTEDGKNVYVPPSTPQTYYGSETGAPYTTEDGTKIYVPE